MEQPCQKDEDPGRGWCCCNCKHQVLVFKHPWNSGDAKGSISEFYGMLCISPEVNKRGTGIFMDGQHGMCEVHEQRKET